MNNIIDKEILDSTIYDLENNSNSCRLFGISKVEGVISMPYSSPSEQLNTFINYLYESNNMDIQYRTQYEAIKNKDIEKLTIEECITYLTFIIRGDRFSAGFLAAAVENKKFLKLLKRIKKLQQ